LIFNPNKLRAEFNQFVGIEPDFDREHRLVNQIADSVIDGDVEYLRLKRRNRHKTTNQKRQNTNRQRY
jgi:predicted metal-dependent hydrolase